MNPFDFKSIYVHETHGKIAALFDDTCSKSPFFIFFDELDALMPSCSGDLHHSQTAEVNEFLAQLNKSAKSGLLTDLSYLTRFGETVAARKLLSR